jgi:predicted ATPase/class 3 adenylate cyclase
MSEIEKLEQAVQALESQRATLGDGVADAALIPLREKLSSLRAVSAQASGENEQFRKIVTVMFADISGFTAMSETMDAEDVRDTMNALWERLDGVILQNGGRIDKHMGDGVMALWGADETREDDPERTIRAALAMQVELTAFHPSGSDFNLRMRIGLNTGAVLLGSIGTRGEYTAMGDTVNVASRLEQSSPPGGILISHDTYRHVRGVFDVESQALLDVRGKAEQVQTYLVKNSKPRAFRLHTRGVEGVETHMIGRDLELRDLQHAFTLAADESAKRIITVVGDAGIGKSRLLYEFNAWAELQTIPWWNFKGRASLATMNAPYALLRDIFSFRFEIQDSDPLNVAREKLEQGFAQFMGNDPRALERAHVIGHLLGLDFSSSPHLQTLRHDPRQLRSQALFYLEQFFETVCMQSLAVMTIDDLQWADLASLDALKYLFENFPVGYPVVAVCMARPTLFERYENWGQNTLPYQRIDLDTLTKDESRRLVGDILRKVPDLPSALQELIVGGAEGNPFYVEELIKMLIDSKVIRPGDDVWHVDPSRFAMVNVPPTLTEVLQARLDSLPAIERMVLQRASMVGRVFWDEAIAATGAGIQRDQITTALAGLLRKELIYARKPAAFANVHEYIFKHTLLHEVTYETLLKRQRTTFHLNVAEWLEQISGERRSDYLPLIAEHYEKASDFIRAAAILQEAGESALGLSALSEAAHFFERVLFMLADQKDLPAEMIAKLELQLGETYMHLADYDVARMHTEAAWSAAQTIPSDEIIAEAQNLLGQIVLFQGDTASAKSFLLAALYLVRHSSHADRAALARVLVALSSVEWRIGDWETARQYAQESFDIAQKIGDDTIATTALNRLGVIAGSLGNVEEEAQYYERSLAIATARGNRERMSIALNNLGAVASWLNQWQSSWDYYSQAFIISKETGAQQSMALYMINLGLAGSKLGKLEEARQNLRTGTTLALKLGAIPVVISAVTYFGLLAYIEGDVSRALQLFGLAQANPAYDSEHEREIKMFLADWKLEADLVQAGIEAGRFMDFNAVVHSLID